VTTPSSAAVARPESPWAYERGVQRWLVADCGAQLLVIGPGDRLDVVDTDGCSRAEISAWDDRGRQDLGAFGLRPDADAGGLGRAAGGGSELGRQLGALGVDPESARAATFFGGSGDAGRRIGLVAERAVICAVAAPGTRMAVDRQEPPGRLLVEVRRMINPDRPFVAPPPPLADPLVELRVERATAVAYEVEAGQYLQIIDIEGQQCSDLLAFRADALAAGREMGIDPTTTRSLIGRQYPLPGLYAKYFSADTRPLLEVVRDTVGRHDTFGLACYSKFYADLGYPGHPNCTDNFNRALAPYGIEPKAGWTAVNLFFNTSLGADGTITLDEPWSRPGDYVLLRATTDVVCGSSACPDDIDATNAWWPTDIGVRVYSSSLGASRATARRVTPNSPPTLTKETGFHPRISALTSRLTEYRGYWLPTSFPTHGAIAEYWGCRERAAVMDLSPLRKFEVVGPDAESLLQATLTRNIRKLSIGQVVYTAMCNDTGGMIDDATCFRLGADNFRFVGGDDYDAIWLREQAASRRLRAWVRDSTDQIHNLALQGPASRDLLRPLVWTRPDQPTFDQLTWFRFTIARLGPGDRGSPEGIPVVISRTGYSGELGYEIWCHPGDAPAVWDTIWEAGPPHGLVPLGLEALDMLRIEAGLIFAGYDFSDQVDPFEAGIGFSVALSHEEDFVGRAALEQRKASPQRVLVGLELDGEEVAAHGDCVHVGGRHQIGEITSATRSPLLGKSIALARLAAGYSGLGTRVEVAKLDGHQKRIPATVVRFPFYDPEKLRPRS
jgi:aminomethyltransferase